MSLRGFWRVMSYLLIIIFIAKFWLDGKIALTKNPLGKNLLLYIRGLLLLLSRAKILHQGGSNVKKMVLESSPMTYE